MDASCCAGTASLLSSQQVARRPCYSLSKHLLCVLSDRTGDLTHGVTHFTTSCSMLAQLGRRSAIALERFHRPCNLRACTSFSIATQQQQHFHKSAHKQSDAQAQSSVTSNGVQEGSSEAAMSPAKLRAQAKELQFLQRKAQEVRASPFNSPLIVLL
jgi:hypothetical protein